VRNLDVNRALRNVLMTLQADPQRYRCFGVYWWPMKALLRQQFGQQQLYMLGKYEDPEVAALVPDLSLTQMLAAAFEEYGQNLRYGPDGRTTAPNGEPVTIFDADAGL
jgi:hypothetical protein